MRGQRAGAATRRSVAAGSEKTQPLKEEAPLNFFNRRGSGQSSRGLLKAAVAAGHDAPGHLGLTVERVIPGDYMIVKFKMW